MIVSTFGNATVLPCGTTSVSGVNPLERVLILKWPGLGLGLPALGRKYTRPSLTSPALTDWPAPATSFRVPLMLPIPTSTIGAGFAMAAGFATTTGLAAGLVATTAGFIGGSATGAGAIGLGAACTAIGVGSTTGVAI